MCKILVLAGYGQSAELYRGRLATLRAELSDTAELVFINPTHEMKIPTETGSFSGSYDTNEEWDDVHAPRCWWNAPEGGPEGDLRYRSCLHKEFDDTLHYLRNVLETQGPFDGVIGFSQGAACASILTALLERPSLEPIFAARPSNPSVAWPHRPFKFSILVSGFIPSDSKAQQYYSKASVKTPTLHVMARGDTIVCPEVRTFPLIESFTNARVEWHSGGHFTPTKSTWRRFFKGYVEAFEHGSGWVDVEKLASPTANAYVPGAPW